MFFLAAHGVHQLPVQPRIVWLEVGPRLDDALPSLVLERLFQARVAHFAAQCHIRRGCGVLPNREGQHPRLRFLGQADRPADLRDAGLGGGRSGLGNLLSFGRGFGRRPAR